METDFIFAIIGEELGFMGACSVIILVLLIVIECINIARLSKDLAGSIIACGMAALIGFQSFLNMSVATGLLPNTGIPFPFVSYGLTSLISLYAGIGILLQKEFRKQGYAQEALQLLLDYCFKTLMLKQVYCLIDVLNTDSINLFTKIGFEQCGYRKEWIRTPNGFIDEIELQYINKNFK